MYLFSRSVVSIQDTKERIFMNGQIYSRPRFGGPVGAPDNRRFTPDPNPYDVMPEPRGYGQGSVKEPDLRGIFNRPDLLDDPYYRPPHNFDPVTPEEYEQIRIIEGRGDAKGTSPEVQDSFRFMNGYLYDLNTVPNSEVMGPKEQVFPRYANPEDGTLNNEEMARVDPTDKLLLNSLRKGEIGPLTDPRIKKAIIDLERKIYNDGRASSMDGALMAADPSFAIPREVSPQQVREINTRVISDYDQKKEMLRRGFLAPLLRGV